MQFHEKILYKNLFQLNDYDEDDLIPDTEPVQQFSSHTGGVYKILQYPNQKDIFASCSTDCTIKIWKTKDINSMKEFKNSNPITLNGHFGYVVDMTWLGGGSSTNNNNNNNNWRLASASHDGSVKIWNALKAECLFTLQEGGLGPVNCVSATNSGLYLASAGHDGQVYFWNLQTGTLIDTYEGPGRIMEAKFNHSDSKFVLTSYGTVIVLELSFNSLKNRVRLNSHRSDRSFR